MRLERLSDSQDLSGFLCGVKALDDWLRVHALENQRRDLSRTFILISDLDEIAGYFSLTMGGVRSGSLPPSLARGLPAVDIGMVLLGRLAVARKFQGQGFGRDLLVAAVAQAARAGQRAAARFIAVDPIDQEAFRFYRHFGFIAIPGDDDGRLFLRIDHALAAFGLPTDPSHPPGGHQVLGRGDLP